MIIVKNKSQIEKMRIAGKKLFEVVCYSKELVVEGISTYEIDSFIEKKMISLGLKPVCKGYGGFPASSCISINDMIVHGVPKKNILVKNGDLVKIDIVGAYKGYCADLARGFVCGNAQESVSLINDVASSALDLAIAAVRPGIRLSNISSIIGDFIVKNSFFVVKEFSGHGIGKDIHESPEVYNYGEPGFGPVLQTGMTLAIEPILAASDGEVVIESDGWTARMADGAISAHFEDTIVVTDNGCEILTRSMDF